MKGGSPLFTSCPQVIVSPVFITLDYTDQFMSIIFKIMIALGKQFSYFCSSELCTWYIKWVVKGRMSEMRP